MSECLSKGLRGGKALALLKDDIKHLKKKMCLDVGQASEYVPRGQLSWRLNQDPQLLNQCSVLCGKIAQKNSPVNKFLVNKNNEIIWKIQELLAG